MYMQLARWCYAHRRPVVIVWIAAVVLAGVAVAIVGSDFTGNPEAPESESRDGFAVLEEHFDGLGAGPTGSIVFQADQGVTDPEVQAAMEGLFARTAEIDHVDVTSPYAPEGFGQIAEQGELAGRVAFARVEVGEEVGFSQSGEIGVEILDRADRGALASLLARPGPGGGGGRLPEWLSTHPNPENRVEANQRRRGDLQVEIGALGVRNERLHEHDVVVRRAGGTVDIKRHVPRPPGLPDSQARWRTSRAQRVAPPTCMQVSRGSCCPRRGHCSRR